MLSPPTGPTRVLLVDEPSQTEMYALQLERAGYVVMSAHDGDGAMRTARDFVPDAIVLEVGLPGIDGLNMLFRLKEDPATAGIPVVVLTAAVFQLTEHAVMTSGASALLWKPCYPADLLAVLEQLRGASGTEPAI